MNKKLYTNFINIFLLYTLSLFFVSNTFSQDVKINSITVPNSVNLCGDGINYQGSQTIVTVNAQLLNGTSGTFTIQLPIGFKFLNTTPSSSVSYSVNATNTNAPIITCSSLISNDFSFTITADCSYTPARTIIATATSGGSTVTSAFIANVNEPNIIQLSWTNDVVNGVCVGATIVRTIVIKNGDIGYAKTFDFQSINDPASVQIISTTIPSGTLVGTVSGDTTKYTISGGVFPAGLLGTNYFEDQETITITQTIKVIGCANLTGKYRTVFGCINTASCQVSEHVNIVNVGTGVPAFTLTKITDAPFPMCTGLTTTSSGIWEFTNTSSGICAALRFAELRADFGDYGPSGYGTVKEIRMLNALGTIVPFSNPINNSSALCNFAGFSSDPDALGGFEDINGDGIFDELPVGAKIRLWVKIEIAVYPGCTYYPAYNEMNWNVIVKSLCGDLQPNRYIPYTGLWFTGRGGIVLTSAPSDMSGGDFGYIKGYESYQSIGWDCATPIFKLKIVLPKGFVYDPTGNVAFTLGGSMGLNYANTVLGAGLLPDTVIFNAVNYLGDFRIPIRLNCAQGTGLGGVQAIVQYQCSAGCLPLYLGCFTYPITPHCPGPCASGITIKNIKVERITLGYTDYTYTTKVNPTILNNDANPNNDIDLNQASPYDTINVQGTSLTTTAIINSNLDYVISVPEVTYNGYQANVFGGAFGDNPLIWVGGNINLGGASSLLSSPTSIVHTGTNWIFTFNLNSLTPIATLSTVTVNALFTINRSLYPNAGHAALIDYQIRGKFSENGVVCSDYGDHLFIHDSYDSRYQSVILNFNGCDELNYYQDFWHMGYDFSYPNECRVRRRMDSIVLELPAGVNYSSGGTWNNQVNGEVPITVTQTGRHLKMIPTPGLNQNIAYEYNRSFPYFQVRLKAGCETPITTTFVNFIVYSTNYAYTGNTTCLQQAVNNAIAGQPLNNAGQTNATVVNNKPYIKISNAITTPTTNPFSWTFTVSNPTTAALSNVFLSFENPSNQITYNTLEDITAGSVAVPLTTYAGTKKWTAGGAAVTIAGLATKTYKLTVTGGSNCAPDSVIVKAGWDCNALPSNPDGYACALVQGKLYSNEINNTAEIGIQANFSPTISQPLGSTINFTGSFNTTNIGHVYNNVMTASLPNGLSYTNGSAQYEYPSGSGTWVNITPTISGAGAILTLNFSPITGVNGLFGAADASAGNDKINFRFSVTTICGFSTDSRVYFDVAATSTCGAAINSNTAYTNPIVQVGFSGYRWLGVNNDWFNPINWCANGAIPSTTSDVYIPTVLTNIYPLITTGAANCRRIAVDAGTSIVITNTGSLNIYGTITNNGIINAVDGGIGIGFASFPTIPKPYADSIIASKFYNNTVKNLIIHENVSFTTNAYDTLKVTDNLSFGNVNSKTLKTWGNLTLVSNALGTANVNDLTNNGFNTGNIVSGDVIIERYLFAKKAWRLLATPINTPGSPSVKNSWMEAVGGITNTLSTGYGTQTTGPGGTGAGFDAYSQRVSIKYYNPVADNFIDVSNTNNVIANSAGYFLFVRGDRSVTQYGLGSTTLRLKGQLRAGLFQQFAFPATGYFLSVGNPFASRINFKSVIRTNITNSFTVWNPLSPGLYNLGAYETYVYNAGTNNYERPGGIVRNYIESGEAFFISRTTLGTNRIRIFESSKGLGSSLQSRTGVTNPTLEILMYVRDTIGTNTYMADGVIMNFDKNYSSGLDNDDVLKLSNAYDNISIVKNNTKLIAERLQKLQVTDTIKLNISGMHTGAYRLDVDPSNISYTELEPFLVDKYTSVKTPLSFSDVISYNFTINSTANSYAADRFMIVFKQAPTTALTTITAKRNTDNTITVNWGATNERNVEKYIVEQSNDAVNFTELSIQNPTANNGTNSSYEKLDAGATKANNWYRIKANNIGGTVKYSAIAMVAAVNPIVETREPKLSINPNPILNGIINLRLENQVAGNYEIQVTNAVGQIMHKQKLIVQSNNVLSNIKLNNAAKGNYVLTVKDVEGNKVIISFIIE